MNKSKLVLLILVMLIISSNQSKSQIYDCTVSKGAGDYFPSADFRIYIPDTVSTIRGVYCYVHGGNGDSRSIVTDPTFIQLCNETGFALLGVRLQAGYDPYFFYGFGLKKSLLRALQCFATQSSHPEIEYAPIFFEGYSWGAGFAYFFTMWKPEVVIGFNPQKIGVDTVDVGEAINVPGYLIYGEFDSGLDLAPAFEKHRPQCALWTLAMEPGGTHNTITDRNLLDNYFKDVIELRLPTNLIPGQPVVLNTIDESVGWLGDRSTFEIAEYDSFTGDKSQACWLPSQDAAQRWQNFVSGNKSGKISKYRSSSEAKNGPYFQDSSLSPDIMNIESSPKITNLTNANASFIGESTVNLSGYTVVSAGDVNGDGLDDFLIGACFNNENGSITGQTYLILGRAAADWGMDFNLSQADASFVGEVRCDRSGFSISAAGDVNGDGLNDFLIGAPFNDENGSDAGQTYMILGRAAADWGMDFDLSQADASFIGESEDDWSGSCISSAGDVNGDGLDDFLIGANGRDVSRSSTFMDRNSGKTYLLLGRATADWGPDFNLSQSDASFTGEARADRSGFCVSSAGDVNGDGLDDFLIGTLLNDLFNQSARNSNTYLILGRAAADWGTEYNLSQANASFLGEKRFDFAGYSVSCAGDINEDGMDDFIIGAYDNSEGGYSAGQSYIILGKAEADWGLNFNLSQADASFLGESSFDVSGFSVSGAGDVNGDGKTDFIIGAPNNCLGGYFAGSTYLINGTEMSNWGIDYDLANADAVLIGEMEQDLFGFSVASAGDVDGDGKDDIIIGACYNDEGGSWAGQTYLFLGSMLSNIAQNMKSPIQFSLNQNYPNPFNPSTTIEFQIPNSKFTTLKVYNILGAEVATLVSDKLQAGRHTFQFDGSKLASGVYYYQVSAGEYRAVKKMILLR